jgi:hypothetical protein
MQVGGESVKKLDTKNPSSQPLLSDYPAPYISASMDISASPDTKCSAYLEVRTHLNGWAIAVGARTGQMEPAKYFSGKGPGSEPERSTLRMLAYRYEAEKQRPSASVGKRSLFLRLISIGANPSASFRLGSGWPGPLAADHWVATSKHMVSSVVRLSSRATDNVASSIGDATAVGTDGNEHVAKISRTPNKAMQLTRGASEASGLRRPHLCLVPLAADRECSVGRRGRKIYDPGKSEVPAWIGFAGSTKFLLKKGPQPPEGTSTLMTLACRYDSVGEAARTDGTASPAESDRQAYITKNAPPPGGAVATIGETLGR